VRRELWEYRSLYLAPLAVAGVTLLGFLIASLGRALNDARHGSEARGTRKPSTFAALLIMLTTFIVAVVLLPRRAARRTSRPQHFVLEIAAGFRPHDRAGEGKHTARVLPLITFAITIAMQWIMLLVSTASADGKRPKCQDALDPFIRNVDRAALPSSSHSWTLVCAIYAWLLLVSAWARRAAFLWAFLPPLAIGVVEKIAFNTSHFGAC